ncbi:PLDc_N domain-containing protein [Brevibacterium casei]|uniref:Cardiolipin synthase N-terminal domain-containing protein n=1 Tax=Brevibacterium casei S18 TaxID=1229781 RepID=K9AVG7_9MICO|nr:PLD nuclease N-terminal domain-containing protein [Brevibacterium casei]EKU45450.1 hypothetical protein C272_14815 [Brevibacterium casei S18]QQT69203.1 PLDc_N domain-containing protein [Brevibacterium casei]
MPAENPILPATYDIVWSGIVVAGLILTIWAMVSILRSGFDPRARLVWAIIVLLLPVVGAALWFYYRTLPRCAA